MERQMANGQIPGPKGKQKNGNKAFEDVVNTSSEKPMDIDQRAKAEEDKGKQKVKVSIGYTISKHDEGGLFYGTWSPTLDILPLDIPVSFIPFERAADAVATFQVLRSHDRRKNIVDSERVIDASVPGFDKFLVVERVCTLDHYFELKLSEFRKMHTDIQDANKALWWNHIKMSFDNIFRDVVQGMLYLHSLNQCFGNVKCGIYVSTVHGEQGRVIPAANTAEDFMWSDALELKSKMSDIISLPFGPTDVLHDANFQLPDTLKRSLLLLSRENANHFDARMLYDIPYLWTDKGMKFLYNLCSQFKRNIAFKDMMEFELASIDSSRMGKNSPPWRAMLPTTGELWEIYSKTFHHAKYDKEVDIVRYFVAVYDHYGCAFSNNALFNEGDGKELQKLFPDVHNRLIEALVKCFAKHKRFRGIEEKLLSVAPFNYY